MAAFVFALVVLMWLWSVMSQNLAEWLNRKALSRSLVYIALIVALSSGASLLLALTYIALPDSPLIQNWTPLMLARTQLLSLALVLLVAVVEFWHICRQLAAIFTASHQTL